jgi:hypothetical protein
MSALSIILPHDGNAIDDGKDVSKDGFVSRRNGGLNGCQYENNAGRN